MKPLVIIPARGGSKGIPGKNIKVLGTKPLIQHTVDAALKVFSKDRIIVSTDDKIIKDTVESFGLPVPFIRPNELSTDTASSYDVIMHAMDYAELHNIDFDVVILLQPTSPFRTDINIKEALALFSLDLDMVVSVKESEENPYYSLFEESSDGYLHKSKLGTFTRRQDCPKVYSYNGAIYVMNKKSLKSKAIHEFEKIQKYEMSAMRSVDLDSMLDWKFAELVYQELTS